jgi:hypothetical protein
MENQYARPAKPEDPNAEYLTVQETAWVFKCSVKTIRRLRKELGLGSQLGKRIMIDRDERRAMFDARRTGGTPTRIPGQRRRKPVKRPAAIPAAKTPAAA